MSKEVKQICMDLMQQIRGILLKGEASDRREIVKLKLRIDRMLSGHVEEK